MVYKAPTAAKPSHSIFDPFNSSGTGHQRAENTLNGSTSWRHSRHTKLHQQFTGGAGGGRRVNDTVGAGSFALGKDGRSENVGREKGARGLRKDGQQSIWETMKIRKKAEGGQKVDQGAGAHREADERPTKRIKLEEGPVKCFRVDKGPTKRIKAEEGPIEDISFDERSARRTKCDENTQKPALIDPPLTPSRKSRDGSRRGSIRESSRPASYHEFSPSDLLSPIDPIATPYRISASERISPERPSAVASKKITPPSPPPPAPPPPIFSHLTFYINGCTAPLSDHQLKHIISTHGGHVSIALSRRTVTHVVLGKAQARGGCGGGLAARKMHQEISCLRGKSVKFVTAEWVSESIRAGKRLAESRFVAMHLAPSGVGGISALLKSEGF